MNAQQPLRLTDFTTVDITVERIGAGGFGLVYMGPDRVRGRWMALKTLRPELLALRSDLRTLFLRECITSVGLWLHANLVTAQGATDIDGNIYLVLDYAQGGSLRDQLAFDQPFAMRLAWAQMIAAGLGALHTPDPEFLRPHPLVHRDLKPENVLVDASSYARITDFGLAAAIGEALAQIPEAPEAFALIEHLSAQANQANPVTPSTTGGHAARATHTAHFRTHTVTAGVAGLGGVGTIQYMPPEQWLEGGKVGASADLYAFGLILSELLAGRHGLADLEADLDEDDWYQLHLTGSPRPLRTGPADGANRLPGEVERLYEALLAKRPEDRPTAMESLNILRRVASQLGVRPYTPPDAVLRTDNNIFTKWNNWATTCARFGLFEEALERNERATALRPKSSMALSARGTILAELGERARNTGEARQIHEGKRLLEEALGWYDRAVSADSDATDQERAGALGMKAARLDELGRHAEAEDAYATALAVTPEHGGMWYNRANNGLEWARIEVVAGRRSEARQLYTLAENYIKQAQKMGFHHPNVAAMLNVIQQERARLGA